MSTIAASLAAARQQVAASEARLLLRQVLGCEPAYLTTHGDDELTPAIAEQYFSLIARRQTGEPIAYLTQSREFYGRSFHVAAGVLVPRPETELIVDCVLAEYRDARGFSRAKAPNTALRILDLGTGSGCLAITLALELPQAEVTALDLSPPALAIAKRNAAHLNAKVRLLESDWFSAIGNAHYDLIVANPPYIAADDPHLARGDLRFEPAAALAAGHDGLDAIRLVVKGAAKHLNPGARLLLEHGYDQADRVRALLETHGFMAIEQHRDLAGIVRVSGGRCR